MRQNFGGRKFCQNWGICVNLPKFPCAIFKSGDMRYCHEVKGANGVDKIGWYS